MQPGHYHNRASETQCVVPRGEKETVIAAEIRPKLGFIGFFKNNLMYSRETIKYGPTNGRG